MCVDTTSVPCSRPTAVNLKDSADKLTVVTQRAAAAQGATPQSLAATVIDACEAFLPEDVAANKVRGRRIPLPTPTHRD